MLDKWINFNDQLLYCVLDFFFLLFFFLLFVFLIHDLLEMLLDFVVGSVV